MGPLSASRKSLSETYYGKRWVMDSSDQFLQTPDWGPHIQEDIPVSTFCDKSFCCLVVSPTFNFPDVFTICWPAGWCAPSGAATFCFDCSRLCLVVFFVLNGRAMCGMLSFGGEDKHKFARVLEVTGMAVITDRSLVSLRLGNTRWMSTIRWFRLCHLARRCLLMNVSNSLDL